MNKIFDQKNMTKNWYLEWETKNYFIPDYKKTKNYCITIPPPNITGHLHMGHAFQCTIMDILIRFYRMNNYCTLWKMGTDHAGIATQILIEQKIKNKNVNNIQYAQKWKKKSNKNIKAQLKKLGCSLNWKTSRFTLDKHFSYAVKTAFIKLYEEKLIYKSTKLVNWDTNLKTAISDLEVIHEEVNSELFYIKYEINDDKIKYITIATTRPETIFADVAIAINPLDKRYKTIANKTATIPIINRSIPIISDPNIDKNFGSGCVKITPAHDFNDFELCKKHNLPIINILNENGTLNNIVPNAYKNLKIEDARNKIKNDLKAANILEKIEIRKNKIPKGDRTNSIIEPRITDQWYIKIKPLADPIYNEIKNNKIKIIPFKWKKIFINWLENIKDWCISRQIWWGHKIPIWYNEKNEEYVGYSRKHISKKYNINEENLSQDVNVLDTWFSSALWPFASLGWPNKKIEYIKFYPTNILVTGFDIIFFWAIKMMMFGLKFTSTLPFKEIYIHGLIRDHLGDKMSKTKGNVIDPIDIITGITKTELINKRTANLLNDKHKIKIINNTQNHFPNGIEAFGTDALRLTFCSISSENIAIKLDIEKIKTYKNFCTKIWNAGFFIRNNIIKKNIKYEKPKNIYNNYINIIWQESKKEAIKNIKNKKFNLLIENLYKFFWTTFCNWHIECSKIMLKDNKYKNETSINNTFIFKEFLKVIHPIAPFITEELWHLLNEKTLLITEKFPKNKKLDFPKNKKLDIENIKELCTKIRNIKLGNKDAIMINIINITKLNLNKVEKHKKMLEKLLKIKNLKLSQNVNIFYHKINNYEIYINK